MVSSSLPDRWCTRVTADVHDQSTAYATFSGYKIDELLPHIYKTIDNGSSWTDISGNLVDIPVNDILPDPQIADRLYIGTDFGPYYSDDGGNIWQYMGDHPLCPVFDIDLHDGDRKLVTGTHGRSMYSFDISTSGVSETPGNNPAPFVLNRNYPEPFDISTTISFEALSEAHIKLNAYDVNGRLIVNIFDGIIAPGRHSYQFDAADLPSGVYFISLTSGNNRISRRITLIR